MFSRVEDILTKNPTIPQSRVEDLLVQLMEGLPTDEHIRDLVGSPLKADTVSEMTDDTKIYIYTGSETGYTAGHWYYYNGSSWADGGVYNSAGINTDKTLSVEDKAADGKAVGDELSSLKSDLSKITDALPTAEPEWSLYTHTVVPTKFVNRSGEILDSPYADYTAIQYDNKLYKISGNFSNNNLIAPVLYMSGTGAVLGVEPSTSDSSFQDYELTIPTGTATIYLTFPRGNTVSVYKASDVEFLEVASKDELEEIEQDISELDGKIDDVTDVFDVLPKSTTWEAVTYTKNSGYYINRNTAQQASSQYSAYTTIDCTSSDLIKVTMSSSCNQVIIPILYVDASNNILGHEPLVEEANVTFTDYVLTIPANTAKVYLSFGVNNTLSISKGMTEYLDAASAASVNAKMDSPATSGTSGQVLTSNGSGGVSWESIPIDDTLKIVNKCADAKAVGDAIAEEKSEMHENLGLITECGINCLDTNSIIGKKHSDILPTKDSYYEIPVDWSKIPGDVLPQYLILFLDNERSNHCYVSYITNGEESVKTGTSRYALTPT